MKRIMLMLAIAAPAKMKAQEQLHLRQGQTLEYTVQAGGGIFPMTFEIDSLSESRIELDWRLSQSKGRFIMNRASLDSAAEAYWEQPRDFEEMVIPATHNILMLSRKAFRTLKENKKVVFDGAMLSLADKVPEPFFMNGKKIDALYAESQSGLRLWILNDPAAPLLLKIVNNPFMVDATLDNIRYNIRLNN